MKKNILVIILTLLFLIGNTQTDTIQSNTPIKTHKKFPCKQFIIPASLIVSGVVLELTPWKKEFKEKRIEPLFGESYHNTADDYIQYAPIVILIAADIFTDDRKNTIWNQTKYFAISNILSGAITWGLKCSTYETRPNGGHYSFPSGHTSLAFTNAAILFEEYKDQNLWIAYSGYGFAIATGIMRMANNKHWISDVLVGAGIGIGVVKLVYWLEPLKNWQPFRNKNVVIFPNYYDNALLLGINYKF